MRTVARHCLDIRNSYHVTLAHHKTKDQPKEHRWFIDPGSVRQYAVTNDARRRAVAPSEDSCREQNPTDVGARRVRRRMPRGPAEGSPSMRIDSDDSQGECGLDRTRHQARRMDQHPMELRGVSEAVPIDLLHLSGLV